ncbi:MAG: hypothetical protein QM756_26790 [Polyangiaceae bacterium]
MPSVAAPASERSAPSKSRSAGKRDESTPTKASARKAAAEASESSASSESPSSDTTSPAPEKTVLAEDPPAPPKGNASDPEFNREAAAQGLGDAASRVESCRSVGAATGSGQATVTFAPSGHVSATNIGGEFAGTTVGACIARLFRAVTVPAFSGESVTVSKRFSLE